MVQAQTVGVFAPIIWVIQSIIDAIKEIGRLLFNVTWDDRVILLKLSYFFILFAILTPLLRQVLGGRVHHVSTRQTNVIAFLLAFLITLTTSDVVYSYVFGVIGDFVIIGLVILALIFIVTRYLPMIQAARRAGEVGREITLLLGLLFILSFLVWMTNVAAATILGGYQYRSNLTHPSLPGDFLLNWATQHNASAEDVGMGSFLFILWTILEISWALNLIFIVWVIMGRPIFNIVRGPALNLVRRVRGQTTVQNCGQAATTLNNQIQNLVNLITVEILQNRCLEDHAVEAHIRSQNQQDGTNWADLRTHLENLRIQLVNAMNIFQSQVQSIQQGQQLNINQQEEITLRALNRLLRQLTNTLPNILNNLSGSQTQITCNNNQTTVGTIVDEIINQLNLMRQITNVELELGAFINSCI